VKPTFIIIFLLIASFAHGQKQYSEKPSFRLIAFSFHHRARQDFGSDTVKVNLTITHKVRKYAPSQIIGGYAIRTGRRTRYLDCEMRPLPMYVVVIKIKIVP